MPDASLGPARLVHAWRHPRLAQGAGAGAAPDPVETLAHLLREAARAAGGPRGLVWLDSAGPALRPDAESILTAFPIEVRRHAAAAAGIEAFLDGFVDAASDVGGGPALGFRGGWLGHMGYEAVQGLERVRLAAPNDLGLPTASWALHPTWFRVVPHQARLELWTRLDEADARGPPRDAWRHWAEEALRRPLDHTTPMLVTPAALARRAPAQRAQWQALAGRARCSFTPEGFEDAVRAAQRAIRDGEVFQANLAQRLTLASNSDPFAVYVQLRRLNPSPYGCFLEEDWGALASNSPERLVAVRAAADGARIVQARPIAGTRPRHDEAAADARAAQELRDSSKERAEHTMLVDLARNDIGRVAKRGSVRVTEFQAVERYSHVYHLVSEVEGVLAAGTNVGAVVQALFPGGTITGAPKLRAVEVIDRVEPVARGPYTGSAGYVNGDGTLHLNILIRTLVFTPGLVHAYAGAGIVADSDARAEYDETLHKAAAMLAALATVDPTAGGAAAPSPSLEATP